MLGIVEVEQIDIENVFLFESFDCCDFDLYVVGLEFIAVCAHFGYCYLSYLRKGLVDAMWPKVKIISVLQACLYLSLSLFNISTITHSSDLLLKFIEGVGLFLQR